jgi:hypothetical protein
MDGYQKTTKSQKADGERHKVRILPEKKYKHILTGDIVWHMVIINNYTKVCKFEAKGYNLYWLGNEADAVKVFAKVEYKEKNKLTWK